MKVKILLKPPMFTWLPMYNSQCYGFIPSILCERHAPQALSYDSYCTSNSVLNSSQMPVLLLVQCNFAIPLHLLIQCNFLSAQTLLYRDANIKQVTAAEEGCGPVGVWEKKRQRNDWHACWIEVWFVVKYVKKQAWFPQARVWAATYNRHSSQFSAEGGGEEGSLAPLIGLWYNTPHTLANHVAAWGFLKEVTSGQLVETAFSHAALGTGVTSAWKQVYNVLQTCNKKFFVRCG